MERLIEEAAICVLCAILIPFAVPDAEGLVALLCAVLLVCVCHLFERRKFWVIAPLCVLLYLATALVWQAFLLFVPMCAYLLPWSLPRSRLKRLLCVLWIIPLCIACTKGGVSVVYAAVMGIGVLALLLSWRSAGLVEEKRKLVTQHDAMEESRLELARMNRELVEQREYETRLAALNERGRIAREIHDNVGHLLTRSVLQIEAMRVAYGDNDAVAKSLDSVGASLKEALASVRASVHDLHDDSVDLQAELRALIDAQTGLQVKLEYDARYVPLNASYALLAVARESLSNTLRHSNASHVFISVVEYPALYQMKVKDDGTAAAEGDACLSAAYQQDASNERTAKQGAMVSRRPSDSSPGMGLQAMRERIESLGGRIEFNRDGGFGIFIAIPKNRELL